MTQHRLSPWRWLAPFLLAAIVLRLIPIAFGETSAIAPAEMRPAPVSGIDQPGATFPGSAYFFAAGAFDPARSASAARGLDPKWQGNKHILAIDIGPAAAPYRFIGRSMMDRQRAAACLADAIYYEAGNEPVEGQRAVAQVVLNRLRHPAWPNTVCGVVYEGTERKDLRCQFTFSCNGAMARQPDAERWLRARRVAEDALRGDVFAPAGLATYYHTLTVFPGWATRMRASAIIGAHIFYRAPGVDGMPQRFSDVYAGVETIAGPSANAYLAPQQDAAIAPMLIPTMPVDTGVVSAPPQVGHLLPGPSITIPSSISKDLPKSGDIKREYLNSGRALR